MDKERQKEVKKCFGARLRQIRKAKTLTQEAVALGSGLDRSYVGRIERGQANLSLVNIERVAEALGAEVAELFGYPMQSAVGQAMAAGHLKKTLEHRLQRLPNRLVF